MTSTKLALGQNLRFIDSMDAKIEQGKAYRLKLNKFQTIAMHFNPKNCFDFSKKTASW